MSFENLKLFRDIAQTKSLSRAAELNGISPSAASQHVNELERTLGSRLLDRSIRPLSLTPEGKLYAELCRDVLRRNEEFEAALDDLKSDIEGSVRVAAIYSIGISEMWQIEDTLREQLPNVHLDVEYLRPEKVYEAVVTDQVDLGIISYPEANREIAVIPWRDEEMVLATAPSNVLAERFAVTPVDFAGAEFIGFDDDLPIAREIARYLRLHSVEVNTTMHFDNLQMIKEVVMLGSGVSLVPRRVLRSEIAEGRIMAVPLAPPGLSRPVGIIHRKKKRFHRAAKALLDLLRQTPDRETAFAG